MTHYFEKIKNVMVREASKSANQQAQPRYGVVESYNPDTHMVVCSLVPELTAEGEKILTGWLQISSPMVGPNWGIVSPLKVGDQVIMLPMWNSGSEYTILGATFNDDDPPAKGPNDIGGGDETEKIGEFLIRSKSGSTLKFVDENTIMIKSDYHKEEVLHILTKGTDIDIIVSDFIHVQCDTAVVDAKTQVTINSPETVINGHLQVNGSINASANITDYGASMGQMRNLYNPHVHGNGPPPVPQMPK